MFNGFTVDGWSMASFKTLVIDMPRASKMHFVRYVGAGCRFLGTPLPSNVPQMAFKQTRDLT
jgi:hypothetical protein